MGKYTGIETANAVLSRVYPNPFNEVIHVYLSEKAGFGLYSIDGKKVAEGTLVAGDNSILTTDIAKGSYLLKIGNRSVLLVK